MSRAPWWLWTILGTFIVAAILLVVAALTRSRPSGFPLTAIAPRAAPHGLAGPDTVTLDSRPDRWTRFDLARRAVAPPGEPWDIAVKRHRLVVNGGPGLTGQGGVVRLDQPFDSVLAAPAGGYTEARVSPGGDTASDVLDGWYKYSYLSHLLTPHPATFVIRTHDGRYAKLAVLNYYCVNAEPGCLTLVYAYQGDGSRTLSPSPPPEAISEVGDRGRRHGPRQLQPGRRVAEILE